MIVGGWHGKVGAFPQPLNSVSVPHVERDHPPGGVAGPADLNASRVQCLLNAASGVLDSLVPCLDAPSLLPPPLEIRYEATDLITLYLVHSSPLSPKLAGSMIVHSLHRQRTLRAAGEQEDVSRNSR